MLKSLDRTTRASWYFQNYGVSAAQKHTNNLTALLCLFSLCYCLVIEVPFWLPTSLLAVSNQLYFFLSIPHTMCKRTSRHVQQDVCILHGA